jgi:hypothetical protein
MSPARARAIAIHGASAVEAIYPVCSPFGTFSPADRRPGDFRLVQLRIELGPLTVLHHVFFDFDRQPARGRREDNGHASIFRRGVTGCGKWQLIPLVLKHQHRSGGNDGEQARPIRTRCLRAVGQENDSAYQAVAFIGLDQTKGHSHVLPVGAGNDV